MSDAPAPLRSLQREHALLLLAADEFASLLGRGRIKLPARHFDHFSKVMRRHGTWRAFACDGNGTLAVCEVQRETIVLSPEPVQVLQRKAPGVMLVQAWTKPKALSLILQKAAELGAAEIILVVSDYAARGTEKAERMDAILENACMQAYNPFKPVLSQQALMDASVYAGSLTLFGDLGAANRLRTLDLPAGQKIAFINGPEGGFSPREIAWLRAHATGVLLSENVLRSETAAIIALGCLCRNL